MRFHKKVRFAAVVDNKGRILEGGMRPEVEPIEPLERTPELITQLIAHKSAENRAVFLGPPEYSVLVHEKLIAVILYLDDGFILVTTQQPFPLARLNALTKRLIKARTKTSRRS